MGENSAIEWCDHTFNPWIGCQRVSPGCDHCYAERLATARLGVRWGPGAERRRTAPSTWRQPLAWNRRAQREGKRARVFCASLADVFDNQVPDAWMEDLWRLILDTPHLDWLLLTKRPQNIRGRLPNCWGSGLPHVWLGITVENQAEADRRIPHLLAVPARLRFLSCEPLLGPVDFSAWWKNHTPGGAYWHPNGLHWIIAGGESGPGARSAHPDWFRSLRDQCAAAGVPFFFKQWGEWFPGTLEATGEGLIAMPDTDHDPGADCWETGRRIEERRGMLHVGKKLAGALLDGRDHREVPHG